MISGFSLPVKRHVYCNISLLFLKLPQAHKYKGTYLISMYVLSYEKSYDEMKIETYCTSAGCMQWSGELCMQGPMSAAMQCGQGRSGRCRDAVSGMQQRDAANV